MDIAYMDFIAMATECERSRRRRRAETELQTVSRRAIAFDRSRRRRDGETPEQAASRPAADRELTITFNMYVTLFASRPRAARRRAQRALHAKRSEGLCL